jgi:hypothetical protein
VDELPKNAVSEILRRERAKAEEEGVKSEGCNGYVVLGFSGVALALVGNFLVVPSCEGPARRRGLGGFPKAFRLQGTQHT